MTEKCCIPRTLKTNDKFEKNQQRGNVSAKTRKYTNPRATDSEHIRVKKTRLRHNDDDKKTKADAEEAAAKVKHTAHILNMESSDFDENTVSRRANAAMAKVRKSAPIIKKASIIPEKVVTRLAKTRAKTRSIYRHLADILP